MTAPAIGRICHRLDGLPLALELAAARCRLLTPQALQQHLEGTGKHSPLKLLTDGFRDAPPRQRTLRDSIEWSYTLLQEEEKRLAARLAVMHGGGSLEAIERICEEGLSITIFDGLASLVDKHLVQQQEGPDGEPRFVLLEMIQEYMHEQLHISGEEEAMQRQHAMYFMEMAERAEPEWRQAGYYTWSRRFEADLQNVRAALSWSLNGGNVTLGVRLAGAFFLFWYSHGYHTEGRRWTQQLLERLDEVPLEYHAKFLFSAGHMASFSDLETSKQLLTRALALSRDLEDQLQTAWSLTALSYASFRDSHIAIPLVEEGLALFRQLNHQPGVALALNTIGEIARFTGNADHARSAYEECLAICQQTGEICRVIYMYENLALTALHKNDFESALTFGLQVLQFAYTGNTRLVMIAALITLAGAARGLGQSLLAARLLGAAEKNLERLGASYQPIDQWEIRRIVTAVQAQMDEVTFRAAWTEGSKLSLEQAATLVSNECHPPIADGDAA